VIPETIPEVASLDPSVVAGLGVVITMLAGALVLLAKTLAETKQVNAAVNNRPDGEGLFAQLATVQVGLDQLLDAQEDFAKRGWRSLPEDLDTAPKLTQAIRDLQTAQRLLEERQAEMEKRSER